MVSIETALTNLIDAELGILARLIMADRIATSNQTGRHLSSTKVLSLDAVKSPIVAQGVAYWNALRADRRFPARTELSPRAMVGFLKNVAIIDVINSGEDFRYRLVGDAHIEARGSDFTGTMLRAIEERSPGFATRTRDLFESLYRSGEPCVVRGSMDPDASGWRFAYRECAFLPLGTADDAIEGIFAVGVYASAAAVV